VGHTISFTTLALAECIELTKRFDQSCFTEEMWLGQDEWQLLLSSGAESTILLLNGKVIGQAITLPEVMVAAPLSQVDELFEADARGIYSYSEAILPAYQMKGYGSLLMREIAVRMYDRGFTRISAHVRTRFGWHHKRSRALSVSTKRFVDDFWEDPRDQKVEFQTVLLT
jgi:GNAT superfamily N-acetyltransferase